MKWTKGPTKNQTSSPTGWLCMHVWRMSLQKTKSTKISWDDSFVHMFILLIVLLFSVILPQCMRTFAQTSVFLFICMSRNHIGSVCLTGDEKISKDHIYEPPHDKTNKMTVRPVKTQISLDIRPVWSESSLCAQWVAKDPSFLHVDSGDWSNYADAQADLSLCWAHILFCWVCHVVARMLLSGAICVSCTCFCSRSNIHTCVYDSLINFSVLLFPINIRETLSSGLRPVKTKTRLHSHRS